MTVRAIELSEANALIASHHRHHKPVKGHRFSLGAFKDGALVGAALLIEHVLCYDPDVYEQHPERVLFGSNVLGTLIEDLKKREWGIR